MEKIEDVFAEQDGIKSWLIEGIKNFQFGVNNTKTNEIFVFEFKRNSKGILESEIIHQKKGKQKEFRFDVPKEVLQTLIKALEIEKLEQTHTTAYYS